MINEATYEILRLVQIKNVDKNPDRFFESSLEHTLIFDFKIAFEILVLELLRLKYIRIDEEGNYCINKKGKIAAKEYKDYVANLPPAKSIAESVTTPNKANPMTTEFETACERLFQSHKKQIVIHWTNVTYNDFRDISSSILAIAKKNLVDKKVIDIKLKGSHTTTSINPDILQAGNFKEAVEIIETKEIYRARLLSDNPNTQSVTTTPNKKHRNKGIAWYSKPLFTHIIWPFLVVLISAYLIFIFKWN